MRIQRGVTFINSGSYGAIEIIQEVDMDKTIVRHLGQRCSSIDDGNVFTTVELSDSTSLTIIREGRSLDAYVSWEVIEYV